MIAVNRSISACSALALGALVLFVPRAALAQPPPAVDEEPKAPAACGAPGGPACGGDRETPQALPQVPEHGAHDLPAPKEPVIAPDLRPRFLAPRYAEDFYPAMPKEDGLMTGIPIAEDKTGLRFALHGYFRAPMRVTRVPRPQGSTKPNEGNYDIRTPYLVDDDYYRSGFSYTPVSEQDFAEVYLSVGNQHLSATIQYQGSLFSDAARALGDRQPGISQGWLTYRTGDLDFIPGLKTRVRLKGGAFWERYGHLPKYDTYIFARTHQMGENVRLEFERDDWTFWITHGVGTHLEDVAANEGLSLLHYANLGLSYARTIEVGGYVFDSTSKDKKALKDITDSSLVVTGFDVRADTHLAGRVYAATSIVTADQAFYQAPALEVMHSLGGRGLTENYLGTQSSLNGTGSLWNVGFQYDASLADIYRGWTGKGSPLPWNGDVTATLFGLYSFVQSRQAVADPLLNRDDKKAFKWGTEAGYRVTEWFGASFRYDRVVLDVDDSANSFRIFSPKLAFFTSFLTRETIFLQYSRYAYLQRVRLRQGQVQLESIPDDHVLKLQAQIIF